MNLFIWVIIGYICGSIPFSFIIPKIKGIDIRTTGSSNVGGTNALRTLGTFYGALCMFLDFLKALLPSIIAVSIFSKDSMIPYLVVISSVIGHDFPIWLKFKGGKGVASTLGGTMGLNFFIGISFYLIWFPICLITKYVSLGSLMSLLLMTTLGLFFDFYTGLTLLFLTLLSAFKHRNNIIRLIKGNENKTYLFKGKK